MKANIAPVSLTLDQGSLQAPQTAFSEPKTPLDSPAHRSADLRLVIEEDEATGAIVYKTLDRRTGEVVRQLPREEVLRLKDDPHYAPGEVADSRS